MSQDQELDRLLEVVDKLGKYKFKNEVDKRRAMLATREVSDHLQRPIDKIMEMWGAPSKDAALKVGIDTGLFVKWQEAGDVQNTSQLAALTGMEEGLMGLILKHLASWHLVNIEGVDKYSMTHFLKDLRSPEVAGSVNIQVEGFSEMFTYLPAYLKINEYKRPVSHMGSPWTFAHRYGSTFFDFLTQHPIQALAFDGTMKGYSKYRGSWTESFPAEELVKGADSEQPLVVDIGGSLGHDLIAFEKRFPKDSANRLYLLDLPHVIEKAIDPGPGIKKQPFNFFEDYAPKNSRAYLMHSIMHDWPDDKCREILSHITPSMKKGSSRLLVNEIVIPNADPYLYATTFDFIMMSCNGGRERDEEAWRSLLESAGLKIVKVWRHPLAIESVIEAELA